MHMGLDVAPPCPACDYVRRHCRCSPSAEGIPTMEGGFAPTDAMIGIHAPLRAPGYTTNSERTAALGKRFEQEERAYAGIMRRLHEALTNENEEITTWLG